ncbi:MAG: hypothetical protein DRO18_00900 [Thermoprotei archaeon]|nr:MAG: hypothetical protein DRO18_00900 [Thermoprotei archaeon]
MEVTSELLLCLSVGLLAGFMGSLLGIGGGSLTTPILILSGVEPHKAVASSLVAILGTSTGGIHHLYRRGLVKLKVASILESASVSGALLGALLTIRLPSTYVALIVAVALIISSTLFALIPIEVRRKPLLGLRYAYVLSLTISFCAGFISASAGIGGGVVKMPTLILVLGMGVKEAVATSKLMVGITAGTGALIYGIAGHIDLFIVLPLTLGTYLGAWSGAKFLVRIKARYVRLIAIIAYIILSMSLIIRYVITTH